MKTRNVERIGIFFVATAHRDLSEICCICSRFINYGQWYVRAEKGIAHYKCAKKRGWKKQKRKSVSKVKEKAARIEEFRPRIKVVRNGEIIKILTNTALGEFGDKSRRQ